MTCDCTVRYGTQSPAIYIDLWADGSTSNDWLKNKQNATAQDKMGYSGLITST